MPSSRVLVVDDSPEIRRMVTASIKTLGEGIEVVDVPSAEEALFISSTLPLDLVVLDFRLPGMSGLEMVDRLRKRRRDVNIILVTGIEDPVARQQVAEAGVKAFFFKPIEIAAFLEEVKRCLPALPGVAEAATSGQAVPASPPASQTRTAKPPAPSNRQDFRPRLDERLGTLKKKLKATSVLLVNDVGQVVEVVGNPAEITSGSALLPALMDAFRASIRVSDALGKGPTECLLYVAHPRQRIFLALVDPFNLLLLSFSGYVEPEKLGLVDRAIMLAVQDIQIILEHMQEAERDEVKEGSSQADLPADVPIDQTTLAEVSDMFSQAPKGGMEEAEGYWETLGENGMLEGKGGKDDLSFDEARDMGLTLPEEG